MSDQYAIVPFVTQESSKRESGQAKARARECEESALAEGAAWFGQAFGQFLSPLVEHLHQQMEIRPIRNLIQAVEAILSFRDRANGLLLTELGDAMDGIGAEGGGTKRLSRLIHHEEWKALSIEDFLLWRADQSLQELEAAGEDALLIWDGSPWEKPESLKAEGLCAVRSSKAKRLTRIKKGYYNPPRGPIFVPGLHGIGLVLASRHKVAGVVQLALMRWWTSRGVWASYERDEEMKLLRLTETRWGKRVLHVFDQGFAGRPWLGALCGTGARFVVRWNKKFELVSAEGVKQPPWHFSRGKKGLAPRQVHDAVKRKTVEGTILWYPVTHPDFPDKKLTLIVCRRKNGAPWYLLTNEPVETAEQAWRMAMVYIRRWQIEMAFRHLKSEMAIQSVRVQDWEPRLKLLGLVTLAYAFLMALMHPNARRARDWLLSVSCHRTDSRQKEAAIPLTRVRIALSKLWQQHPCPFVRRGAVFR